MSISRINIRMFDYSVREQLKYDASWVVLSFSIEILGAPGVVFTTTNNIYSGCSRSEGLAGFRRLFAPNITRWWNSTVTRSESHPMNWPTDRQAEVLYPGDLALDHLQRIDVQNDLALDDVNGIRGALNIRVPARVEEGTFR
jgi:hypothetical protein